MWTMESEEIYDDVETSTYCDFQKSQDNVHGIYYKGLLNQGAHNSVYACPLVSETDNLELTHHKNYG